MTAEELLREQLVDAFEGASYPVTSPMDLVPALPNGPMTSFEAGDLQFTAMELAQQSEGKQDFPYEDVDSLVDDVIAGLKAEGEL